MRTTALWLILVLAPLGEAAAGEAAGGAPDKREVNAQLQIVAPLSFLTPKEACGESTKLAVSGGKAKLSLPGKAGGVTVFYAQGNVAVVPGDAAAPGNAPVVLVPREGFSQALIHELPVAEGVTTKVALSFARGKGGGELQCRNFAVAVTQVGEHTVYVVDDNCNGKYNDAGEDAIIIDRGRLAAPLGQTVMLGGMPYKAEVAENGRKMTFTAAPAKVGLAGLAAGGTFSHLVGAVVKGPDGSCFPLVPNAAVPLPAGEYSLEFASLMDGSGRKVVIKGGSLKVNVEEGRKAAVVSLNAPRLPLTARVDAKAGNVTLTAPGGDGLECNAGKFTYLFPTPQADIRFIDQSGTKRIVGSLQVGMEGKGLTTTFSPNNYGMLWGLQYQAEMTWPVGVGPAPFGSVGINLPRR
jgi:hypothetical protein